MQGHDAVGGRVSMDGPPLLGPSPPPASVAAMWRWDIVFRPCGGVVADLLSGQLLRISACGRRRRRRRRRPEASYFWSQASARAHMGRRRSAAAYFWTKAPHRATRLKAVLRQRGVGSFRVFGNSGALHRRMTRREADEHDAAQQRGADLARVIGRG